MRRLTRIGLALTLVQSVVIAQSWACSCVQFDQLDEAEFDLIFEGTVKRVPFGAGCGAESDTVFEVDVAIKGTTDGETITVHHHRDSGKNCGVAFARGDAYEVWAYEAQGVVWVDSCSVKPL